MSVNDVVQDFALRLMAVMESAAVEHGEAMIARAFSSLANDANLGLGKAAKKQADRDRNHVVATLTQQFVNAVEKLQRDRIERELVRASAAAFHLPGDRTFRSSESALGSAAPTRRRTRRARPNPRLPPPLDPEQIKRDQEFARLRALLKPVAIEPMVAAPAPLVVAPPVQPARPASPGDVLRALEKEIKSLKILDLLSISASRSPALPCSRGFPWLKPPRALPRHATIYNDSCNNDSCNP